MHFDLKFCDKNTGFITKDLYFSFLSAIHMQQNIAIVSYTCNKAGASESFEL